MNEKKGHLLIFGNKDKEVSVNTCGSVIKEITEETLLEMNLTSAKTCSKSDINIYGCASVSSNNDLIHNVSF